MTVTGLGGTGKTRLALEVSSDVADGYGDGVRVARLAPVRTADGILAAVRSTFGAAAGDPGAGGTLADLVALLRPLELLLVVDNCEHVLADAAGVVDRLLDACPSLEVLATSREPLHLPGEQVVALDPLPVGPCTAERPTDAVRLFAERATAARSDFHLDAGNLADVIAICRQMDGIPLAIEIAAARVAHLSIADIAARLDSEPGSLSSREVTVPHRHRTVVAALDWSFDLLGEQEQTLFCCLAVFSGGADLVAIESVCAPEVPPADALEVLSGLVDKSLVVVEGHDRSSRYRMMETVRRYGLLRLERSGAEATLRRRHAEWLIAEAGRRFRDRDGGGATAGRNDELDDVVTALTWATDAGETELARALAVATWRWWAATGRHAEGRTLLERVLEPGADCPTPERPRVAAAAGALAFAAGDHEAARRRYDAAIAEFRQLGLDGELAAALNSSSMVALFQGDVDAARWSASEALERFERLDGHDAGRAFARSSLGMIDARTGRREAATKHLLDALATFRQLGMAREAASVLNNLGNLAADAGEPLRAHRFYEGALQLQSDAGDDRGAALSLNNLSLAAQQRGNLDRAWEHAEAARERFRALGDRSGEAATVNNLANLAAERGQPHEAMTLYGECIGSFREMRDARRLATALENLADLAGGIGERQLAWDCLIDAVSLWNQLGEQSRRDRGLGELARLGEEWEVTGIQAVVAAAAGEADPAVVSHALESARWVAIPAPPRRREERQGGQLTARETQVVGLVARGMTNAEIAAELFISERTVESHVSNARLKLAVDSRTKLTLWAVEQGLVG